MQIKHQGLPSLAINLIQSQNILLVKALLIAGAERIIVLALRDSGLSDFLSAIETNRGSLSSLSIFESLDVEIRSS